MLLLLLMLISESVLTVLFLLHQQSAVLHIKVLTAWGNHQSRKKGNSKNPDFFF